MHFETSKTALFISSIIGLQSVAYAASVPEYRAPLSEKVFYGPVTSSPATVDFRRNVRAAARDGAAPITAAAVPEARCGSYVYNSDFIQKSLATATDLASKGAKAGTSDFPKTFGNEANVMIFPLLRNGQVFDGTTNTQAGPDRIAFGMEGNRYTVFTAEGQPDPEKAVNFETCEYLMPENARIVPN